MSGFFDFNWSREEFDVRTVQRTFSRPDENLIIVAKNILVASVVTARGRKRSPSLLMEQLANSKRRTNPSIIEHIHGAWNLLVDQNDDTSDRIDVLVSLISPRHRNQKSGVSETLAYQLNVTYESLVEYWVTLADMMVGFRAMAHRVFGVGDCVNFVDYLGRGMSRGSLLASFGHELKPTDDEES